MVIIDGSSGQGGGQILRSACSLSVILKEPFCIFNIRKEKENPGLALQHLLAVEASASLCNAEVKGAKLHSQELEFLPKENLTINSPLKIKIETAASISLILQTLIPPLLFFEKPTKILFKGGSTDTFLSPPIDYVQYVFLEILKKMGIKTELNIIRRGYCPKGGAIVEATVFPGKIKPLLLTERGRLERIKIISGASSFLQKQKVAQRQISGTKSLFGSNLKLPISESWDYYDTLCPGSNISIIAEFENTAIGENSLGQIGKPAEIVGKETAQKMIALSKEKACVDRYMLDQILIYMALSQGLSKITFPEITGHCKTNMWVIEKFVQGKFEIKEGVLSFQG